MKKIIIVDDLKSILITLESILKPHGYYVASCTNSIDAFDKLNNEHFDLMITDAIMPVGANGYTLISSVRSGTRNKDLPIIMLTGKREKADIEKALMAGANDYIIKPIDPDILITKVKTFLEAADNKSEFVEAPVNFPASLNLKTEIAAISESEIKLVINYQLNLGQLYRITSEFFSELDMTSVNTRISECVKSEDPLSNNYYVSAQFVGLTDKELSKIRLWVRKKLSGV